jgi:hypothetical protein
MTKANKIQSATNADPKKENQDMESISIAFKKTFSGPHGSTILKYLMSRYHFIGGTFNENSNKMYFNEGERSVLVHIIEMIDIDIDTIRSIQEEAKNDYSS